MRSYAGHYGELLRHIRPETVVEWGPGPNTQIALDAGAHVLSIESERNWIPRGSHSRWTCALTPVDGEWYVRLHGAFDADVAFIDGRRRGECLDVCRIFLRPNAIVCLHDAQRKRYHHHLRAFGQVEFLSSGFAMASNEGDVKHIAERIREEVRNG
jgi:hypothetical protein